MIQLRSSRTDYVSATNKNVNSWNLWSVWNRGIKQVNRSSVNGMCLEIKQNRLKSLPRKTGLPVFPVSNRGQKFLTAIVSTDMLL